MFCTHCKAGHLVKHQHDDHSSKDIWQRSWDNAVLSDERYQTNFNRISLVPLAGICKHCSFCFFFSKRNNVMMIGRSWTLAWYHSSHISPWDPSGGAIVRFGMPPEVVNRRMFGTQSSPCKAPDLCDRLNGKWSTQGGHGREVEDLLKEVKQLWKEWDLSR